MAGVLPINLIEKGFILTGLFLVFIIVVRILVSTISPEYLGLILGTSTIRYNVIFLGVLALGVTITSCVLIMRITER